MVRQYLAEEETGSVRVSASSGAQRTSSSLSAPKVRDVPAPLSGVAGDPALQVNGSAVVTTATFGAGLCEALTYRYVDQGDGTVLDCNTGLIWLKDANCLGVGTWGSSGFPGPTVQAKVFDFNFTAFGSDFGCEDYTEGTYTDWRVPTMSEFCSAGESFGPCPITNYATSLIDVRFPEFLVTTPPPRVSNSDGDGRWTQGDPFFTSVSPTNTLGRTYWTATAYSEIPSAAWAVDLADGEMDVLDQANGKGVWPVRDSQ